MNAIFRFQMHVFFRKKLADEKKSDSRALDNDQALMITCDEKHSCRIFWNLCFLLEILICFVFFFVHLSIFYFLLPWAVLFTIYCVQQTIAPCTNYRVLQRRVFTWFFVYVSWLASHRATWRSPVSKKTQIMLTPFAVFVLLFYCCRCVWMYQMALVVLCVHRGRKTIFKN